MLVNETAPNINLDEVVVFSDVDDCLIDTQGASEVGSFGILSAFTAEVGIEKAFRVQTHFNHLFDLLIAANQNGDPSQLNKDDQVAFGEMTERSEAMQYFVKEEFGHYKRWSREILIKLAAEQAGITSDKISPELIRTATDAYWRILQYHVEIFPDALKLANFLAENGRPLFLATASDARLDLSVDSTHGDQFLYDPQKSETFKRRRMDALKERELDGLPFTEVIIGDPVDKPNPAFFQSMVKMGATALELDGIDLSKAVMLGDSEINDLLPPKEMGFGMVVLRASNQPDVKIQDGKQIAVGSLYDATYFLG